MGPDRARAKGRLLHLGQTVLILSLIHISPPLGEEKPHLANPAATRLPVWARTGAQLAGQTSPLAAWLDFSG